MKVTIEHDQLQTSLGHVQSVVEKRNTIPILSNVLLMAEDGALKFQATDMDIEIIESCAARVQSAGATTVPAHTLYDIVRKLPGDVDVIMDVASDNGILTIQAGRSVFKLGCLPKEDFPQIGADDLDIRFSLDPSDLHDLIDRTRFAMSTEETRYYLNGIYLHVTNDDDGNSVLRAVATDGHRLARYDIPCPDGLRDDMPGIIVPRKTVSELLKLIDDAAGEAIQVELSDKKIRFSFNHIVVTSKLIDGQYPDYKRVIPDGNDLTLAMDPGLFANAVDRVSIVASQKTRAVKMAIHPDHVVLTASGSDAGEAREEFPVNFSGDQLEIGFNARYLLDIAGQIDGDQCQMKLSDPTSPAIIRDAGDMNGLFVLMPMRV